MPWYSLYVLFSSPFHCILLDRKQKGFDRKTLPNLNHVSVERDRETKETDT